MGRQNIELRRREHRQSGEGFRWWKAVKVPEGTSGRTREGVLLIEQTVPDGVKVLVSNTVEETQSVEFGKIKVGTMEVSAIPQWGDFYLRLNHPDRFMPLGVGRALSKYSELTRGNSGTSDTLPFSPVKDITSVHVAGVLQAGSRYAATETGINWLNNAPSAGAKYVVEYEYYPRYVVLPQRERTSPTDRNGHALPLHYWLNLEQPTG